MHACLEDDNDTTSNTTLNLGQEEDSFTCVALESPKAFHAYGSNEWCDHILKSSIAPRRKERRYE